jgi:hypothetical protein
MSDMSSKCKQESLAQISLNLKVSIKFYRISNPCFLPNFVFKLCPESKEVSVRKVIPYFKFIKTIFYLKFLDYGKSIF